MGPGDLQDVLGDLRHEEHADLLVGLGRSDDAAVYRVTDDVAIVETVDFFPPIVDDPYLYGAIAAANSMSDVYAMGGQVLFALNVAGFPRDLPKAIIAAVFRGGADKVREAGGVIAGGHTVVDAEPKYGLCVTGRVDPRRRITCSRLSRGKSLSGSILRSEICPEGAGSWTAGGRPRQSLTSSSLIRLLASWAWRMSG